MKETLSDKIYKDLKKQILSVDFHFNGVMTEKSIAAEYQVSKTPAREALDRLCQEGYVTRHRSTGYFIKELSRKDYQDIFDTRKILEAAALRIIVEQASDEEIRSLFEVINAPQDSYAAYHELNTNFHSMLGELTHNSCIHDYIVQLLNAMARPSAFTRFTNEVRPTNKWHELIIRSLLDRDAEAAIEYLWKDIGY